MKKRLLAALLAVVMVVSMLVFPTAAQEEAAPATEPGYCQHCKQVIPEEQWLPWDVKSTGPRTGHYYLAEDIPDQTAQININLDDDLLRNVICLDLRGRTYTVTGLRPFLIYGIFSIMDSVGGGEITVTGASNAHGAFAMMGKNANSADGSGELNIYSGTLRRIVTTTDLVSYGGLIYLSNGATLNVHGGKLIGGDVVPHLVSKTNYAPLGGTVFCTASTVNVYGGTITGGVSRSGKLLKVGSTTEYQSFEGTGGNIYLEKSSTLNISGGVIENGFADIYGGNIYVSSSEVNISGGVIRDGATIGAGGNLCYYTHGTFNMSGGYITNGTCKSRGGNLFVNATNVSMNISGGTIDGDMSVGLFKSFTLSGAPKILMGNGNGLRLQRATDANQKYDKVINISGLTEGAEIYLDGNRHDPVFTEVLENPEAYLGYFKDAVRADISVDETGALKVEQGNTGYCPHCWESGAEATWAAFDNSAPNTNITITDSRHTYLTGTTNRTRLLVINAGVDYVMDTNGYTLTVTGYKFANLYGTLSIMDAIGNGTITGTGHPIANGGVIMGSATGVFNMYSGTLSRTVKSGEEDKTVLDGGILHAPAGSVTNIYGGIIRDGIAAKSYKSSPIEPCGGNIYSAGTFNMEGGVLLGGKAKSTNGHINDSAGTVINADKTYLGRGGNLYASGTATISGGHIIGGSAAYGGNVYTSSNLAITGGVIRDGIVNDALNSNDWGGNIYYTNVKAATIENAIIRGGKTPNLGGNINLYNSALTITDSYIADGIAGIDGSAGRGGNIYVNGASKLYLNNTVVANGWAYENGANIRSDRGSLVQMTGGLVSGGIAETGFGGSLYLTAFHMIGGRVVGGTSKKHVAGNIYVPAASADYLIVEPAADGAPAVIANGTAGKMGGNIYVDINASATFTGAIICNGTGDTLNANTATNYDNIYMERDTKVTLEDSTVSSIRADVTYGSGVISYGELILKGNTNVINEEKKACAHVGNSGKLTVDESFSGKVAVSFQENQFANVEEPQGTTLAEKNTATGVFSGELLLEGFNCDYGLPAIFAESGDSKLYIASVAVVDPAKDTTAWYKDNNVAAAALTPSSYMKLFKNENELTVAGDVVVDLNGNNLNVTGSGTVYGIDTKNDDYTAFGNMTVADTVEVAPMHVAPNGRRYIALETETGVSFHRLGLAITGVSLRPTAAGVYYKATWECDAVLQEKIDSYGIAVSTADMPGADFAADSDTLYTSLAKESFVSGQAVNSAMVENIISADKDNQTRGNMPIYAAPYAVIGDLTVIGDDNAPTMGGVIYSLKTVLQSVNRVWPKLADSKQESIRQLYALDAAVLDTWDLYNITADINGTPAVRPLKVLTLGHSLAVDSGHMLNLVADAEGFDQPMEIATLYYSGCPLYKHVNYIKENAGVYQLYVSSTTTPDKPPVIIKGVNMKYAIEYMDWDIIVMQGGVFEIAHDETYKDGNIQFIQDYVNQYKTNPNAVFAWHMPWACPTDKSLRDQYPYTPNTYYTSYTAFNDDRTTMYNELVKCVGNNIVTDDSFVYLIASGTAIENALSSYLEETDLHRDYVHVSDLGRVISSYTWYCTLAGIDHLDVLKLDAIPAQFFKSTTGTTDRVLTDMEKAIILESVNNALANPLQMTQSQYTVAP